MTDREARLAGTHNYPTFPPPSSWSVPERPKRIVAKVDELMALVDQLEQQLAHSHTLGQQLLEAVVSQLTTP